MLYVKLPKHLEQGLKSLSDRNKKSQDYYVRKAIAHLLEEEAEERMAAEDYEEFLKGDRKTYSFEEVKTLAFPDEN